MSNNNTKGYPFITFPIERTGEEIRIKSSMFIKKSYNDGLLAGIFIGGGVALIISAIILWSI